MKVTKVPAERNAYSLDFSDKVVFIDLMNELASCVITEESCRINNVHILPSHAERMLKILSDIGCRTALGGDYNDVITQKANLPKA